MPDDKTQAGNFGNQVALSGDGNLVLISAVGESAHSGSVYVFTRSGSKWTRQAKLQTTQPTPYYFGSQLALSRDGSTALISVNSDARGIVCVYTRTAGIWTEQTPLRSDSMDVHIMQGFGSAVALSANGSTAVIGANLDEYPDKTVKGWGAAHVFVRSAGSYVRQAKLYAAPRQESQELGDSLTVSSDGNLVLGGGVAMGELGVGYLFSRTGAVWKQDYRIVSSDKQSFTEFAQTLAMTGDGASLLVGAVAHDDLYNNDGAAYWFVRAPPRVAGSACADQDECATGFCADRVCCNTACGNDTSDDCQACSRAAGAAADGVCGPRAMGQECRRAVSICDIAETCDGKSLACPPDRVVPAHLLCQPANTCNYASYCDGHSGSCYPGPTQPDGAPCPGGSCRFGHCIPKP